ncbi:helicase-related protein [Chloroflexus sp.]|uniref:helicase-related protein n=1 Tax=Chloroflexus sp. TaxID=1904827 RepID=UPI0026129BF3|nr:helicase-related protein [uncultured Chloroflexus sp.]
MTTTQFTPGSIVRCRNRDWVLLPGDDDQLWRLRPLTGATDDVVAIHRGLADLISYTLPEERIRPSFFRLPTPDDLGNASATHLLWQAARLLLRDGAAPIRSLGHISIRPRLYQFVPLLMALRLDPVRLLIADDVGVGKTIEALLIARELWDRGEIKRLAVLCPPYLCDQWYAELTEKFNFPEVVIVRSGTVRQLERQTPPQRTIYEHFPVQVISIDWVKSDRNRHTFLLHTPELVIVDEAHGAAKAHNQNQQQRHRLVQEVAKDPQRHLLLLTATPHSGVEEAFQSLLGLLDPDFATWDIHDLDERRLQKLSQHFVQRTRRDIERDWTRDSCFPQRLAADRPYTLSDTYRALFRKTYDFCAEIVRTGQKLEERKRRVRYWGALALLRCVMSSPAAALTALERRSDSAEPDGTALALIDDEVVDEIDFRGFVFEPDDDRVDDEMPLPLLERTAATLLDAERRKLRELRQLALTVRETNADTKLDTLVQEVRALIDNSFHPIVWCHYVKTAEYVAEALRQRLADPNIQVQCLTGRQPDDERRHRIAEIDVSRPRVLVATDCLSEGINLQESFNAVIHYDLPWNPNRLEQREGRVDRFGQPSPEVQVARIYGTDNPVDGVVLDVLLNKAAEIHRALGTYVPVPAESESVTEAVLNALFLRGWSGGRAPALQLTLDLDVPAVQALHERWQRNVDRERITRTRFAQRSLKPEAVQRELEAIDAVLGDSNAVKNFVLEAAQRLNLPIQPARHAGVFRVTVTAASPEPIREIARSTLPKRASGEWLVSFESPTPEGAIYLGRNHPLVATLARYLFDEALSRGGAAVAARCGVIVTRAVSRLTTLLLLRVRYLIQLPERSPLLAEEVRVAGYFKSSPACSWLPDDESLRLLHEARPDDDVPKAERRERIEAALADWPAIEPLLAQRLRDRATELAAAYKSIRQAAKLRIRELKVEPCLPPDVLGVLVLQPVVGGQA